MSNESGKQATELLHEVSAYCDDFMRLARYLKPEQVAELLVDLGMLYVEYNNIFMAAENPISAPEATE